MKYVQPYGISDPNAPYINGNPTTGTMGSIPPAASIEHDMREIVAVIQYAADHGLIDFNNAVCQNPSEADLQQLLKAIFGLSNRQRVVVPFTFYVNGATGNDTTNDGLTPVAPFKTITKAVNAASLYAPGPNAITIKIAAGSYVGFTLPFYSIPPIIVEGDTLTPTSVVIDGGTQWAAGCGSYNTLSIRYVKLQATGGQHIGPGSSGVVAFQYATINIQAGVTFGKCDLALITSGGQINVGSPFHSNGSASDFFLYAAGGSITCGYLGQGLELFIDAPIALAGSFALAMGTTGIIGSTGVIFNGGSGVSGQRYNANYGGWVDTNVGGPNYFPGTVAGGVANGGIYR
jgi:hypothetical protein